MLLCEDNAAMQRGAGAVLTDNSNDMPLPRLLFLRSAELYGPPLVVARTVAAVC